MSILKYALSHELPRLVHRHLRYEASIKALFRLHSGSTCAFIKAQLRLYLRLFGRGVPFLRSRELIQQRQQRAHSVLLRLRLRPRRLRADSRQPADEVTERLNRRRALPFETLV